MADDQDFEQAQYATLLPETQGQAPAAAASWPDDQPLSAYGRYVVLRPHARGGLGEVFVALDRELGREVAFKQIRDRHADDPTSRGRFVREAEITGNLEHPGIVPVYGFGRSPDGRPYYAMRFIRGESLETAIARFHSAEGPDRDPGARAVERNRLLERFIDVCEAVDYAHGQGIIHRDLKPSNVMLGDHGETLVVDWGLAKPIGRAEGLAADPLRPEAIVTLTASDQTLPGSPLGTPAFMSPEQAAGRVDALRPASDVYNLGATLYCLLAGRLPFETALLGELLAKIQEGDFPAPRSVARGPVPRALEAVCMKAMARNPEDRYPTAIAMAEDIRLWVADEPIAAYPETRTERFRRWTRRHKTWVRGGFALILSLLILMAATTYQANYARLIEQGLRLESDRLNTSLILDQGLSLCEKGETGSGLLRLSHALETAPPETRDLRETVLANLAAWGASTARLEMILPHGDEVFAAAYRPDGRAVLTGGPTADSLRGELRLWDAQTGKALGPPLPHPRPVTSAAFSADGSRVLTGCIDGSARIWNPVSGHLQGSPIPHLAPIHVVAFAPGGTTFLTAGGHSVRVWDLATQRPLPSPDDYPAEINGAAFSPDGRLILTGSQDHFVRLWDVERRQPVGKPVPHDDPVNCVAFSPDGKSFMAGGAHGNVRFWETATLDRYLQRVFHRSEVTSVAYSPDGKTALTGSGDNTAALWDPTTGLPRGMPMEHRGTVRVAAFSPDGKTILTGSSDAAARLWTPPGDRPLRALNRRSGRVLAVAACPKGKTFVVARADGMVSLLDGETLEPIGEPVNREAKAQALGFSPDGTLVAVGGSDGLVRVWEMSTKHSLVTPTGHRGMISAVAFHPSGHSILTGSHDATVRLWDADSGRPIGDPWTQPSAVLAAALSPDGGTAVVACGSTAALWDVATGEPLGINMKHQGAIYGVAFRPDGKIIATGGEDNTVRLWDAATGQPFAAILEHRASVRSIAFSPDGQTLLTGGNDQTARLWSVATGRPIGPPLRQIGAVTAVAFRSDGRTFLTGGDDRTARLWDAPVVPADNPEAVRLWTQVASGLTLDTRANPTGSVARLTAPDWEALRLKLNTLHTAAER